MAFKVVLESVNPVIPSLLPKAGETFMVFRVAGGTEASIHKAGDLFEALSSVLDDGKFELREAGIVLSALLGKDSFEARVLSLVLGELNTSLSDGKITGREALNLVFAVYSAIR